MNKNSDINFFLKLNLNILLLIAESIERKN